MMDSTHVLFTDLTIPRARFRFIPSKPTPVLSQMPAPQVGRTALPKGAPLLEIRTSTLSSFHQQDTSVEDKWLELVPQLKWATAVLLIFSVVIFKNLLKFCFSFNF